MGLPPRPRGDLGRTQPQPREVAGIADRGGVDPGAAFRAEGQRPHGAAVGDLVEGLQRPAQQPECWSGTATTTP